MKVITILAQKGGATKTTLAIHLVVAALQDNKEAMIIDLDPQASAAKWKDLRPGDTPAVITAPASRLEQNLEIARKANADLVIVDTAPHSNNTALTAARSADLIIIPTKCGIMDLQTVPDSIDIAKLANKPAVIVLSAVPVRGTVVEQVRTALQPLGVEISPYTTAYRTAFSTAPNTGLTAQEYEPQGKAAEEIRLLYQWIMSRL